MRPRSLAPLALAVALAGCGSHVHAVGTPHTVRYTDRMRALSLELPAGWRVYHGPLTQAIDVTEQLALGTFPLRQPRADRNCTPTTALRARPPGGGFVYAFEIDPVRRERERLPRTPHLPPAARPFECMGPSWLVRWQVGNRAFQAHIYGPAARRRQALAILRSLRARPAPFTSVHAARFPRAPGWHTRIDHFTDRGPCRRQRVSWAATVPIRDGPDQLPPHRTLAGLAPDGIVMAVTQFSDCRRPRGLPALEPPLDLRTAQRMQFPGPRGDELPLYRITGRFPARYTVDLWLFYGRPDPTAAQRTAAQRELDGVRWPAWL
jgi:hypothetical protein